MRATGGAGGWVATFARLALKDGGLLLYVRSLLLCWLLLAFLYLCVLVRPDIDYCFFAGLAQGCLYRLHDVDIGVLLEGRLQITLDCICPAGIIRQDDVVDALESCGRGRCDQTSRKHLTMRPCLPMMVFIELRHALKCLVIHPFGRVTGVHHAWYLLPGYRLGYSAKRCPAGNAILLEPMVMLKSFYCVIGIGTEILAGL